MNVSAFSLPGRNPETGAAIVRKRFLPDID